MVCLFSGQKDRRFTRKEREPGQVAHIPPQTGGFAVLGYVAEAGNSSAYSHPDTASGPVIERVTVKKHI